METLESILNKEALEKIAKVVQKDAQTELAKNGPGISHAWGPCGYAAKQVVKCLLLEGVPKNMIKIYTFYNGYHTVATVGGDCFKDAWKIDPVADAQADELNETEEEIEIKPVYAPGEKYWITSPTRPEVLEDKYFWQ
jgi:hypothetical protein